MKAALCGQPGRVAQYIPLIKLRVREMVGTDNQVTSNLPFLLDPNRIAKMKNFL